MTIGGSLSINTYGASSAQSGQSARPAYAHNQTWNSLAEMEAAWRNLAKEWAGYYSGAFADAGAEGDGKITQDELSELLQAEFGGMGVKFTDAAVDESKPKAGTFEIYIDTKTRQKMANDSEYRAKVMAVIQSEMAGTQGYSVKMGDRTVSDRTTGLSMNMQDGGPLYEGVPHSAGGTGTGGMAFVTSSTGSGGKSKSLLDLILEKMEERLAEKKAEEEKEAARQRREDLLEISFEARATLTGRAAEKTDAAAETAASADEPEKQADGLNVLA